MTDKQRELNDMGVTVRLLAETVTALAAITDHLHSEVEDLKKRCKLSEERLCDHDLRISDLDGGDDLELVKL